EGMVNRAIAVAGEEVRSDHDVAALEDKPHDRIGRVVKDRADRTDAHDKFRDLAHIPRPWFRNLLRTDVVRRDGDLGKVIEQIVGQYLDGHHRQVWQPETGPNHAEHVAEVRAGAHADVFEDINKYLASFEHPFLEHHQALLEQDHVGGFLGNIHRVVD